MRAMKLMHTQFLLVASLAAAGCATRGGSMTAAGDHITWSTGHSDSPGVPAPVVCTTEISHPCPFLLYTTTFAVDADSSTITWGDPMGGVDAAGYTAEHRGPVAESVMVDPTTGNVELPQHGDDGGFRHAATLILMPGGGYEGDITWTLFTVAGNTTFHVTVN